MSDLEPLIPDTSTNWRFLNDTALQDWEATTEMLQELLSNDASIAPLVFSELCIVLSEFPHKISVDDAISFVNRFVTSDQMAHDFLLSTVSFQVDSKPHLKQVVKNAQISDPIKIAYLDPKLLDEFEIVSLPEFKRTRATFFKESGYSVVSYSLLHESSQGYAKLVTLLFYYFRDPDAELKVDFCWTQIKMLIGHHCLEPVRCISVMLDVVASNLVANFEFAISLLKKACQPFAANIPDLSQDISQRLIFDPSCNNTLSDLVIAKLQSSKTPSDPLKSLVAVLVKEGLVSFPKLFSYLTPKDEEMQKLQEYYDKSLTEEVEKASSSALALAAPLLDDDNMNYKPAASAKTANPRPLTQSKPSIEKNLKVQMLKAFLANGAYNESIFMLSKYPYLAKLDDETACLVCRALEKVIEPFYNTVSPPLASKKLATARKVALSKTSKQDTSVAYKDLDQVNLWSFNPLIRSFAGKQFHYFYQDWHTSLPKVDSQETFIKACQELGSFLGIKITKSPILLVKVARVVKHFVEKSDDKEMWYQFFRLFVFPTLSLVGENSAVVEEIFSIMRNFSLENRFKLYGELFSVTAKKVPEVKLAYSKAEKETKSILKRLSKDNVKQMMRRLAKVSLCNPIPCFTEVIRQIESYDNLTALIVDSSKFFSEYGWDALTFCVLMRLVSGRATVQMDGLNDSQWLQSLADFIGKIARRSPYFNVGPILLYLLKRLHQGGLENLIVLKELVSGMGGVQPISDVTALQISYLNSGASLQRVVYNTIDDRRLESTKTSQRLLRECLDGGFLNELIILLTRAHHETSSLDDHLKARSQKVDEIGCVTQLLIAVVGQCLSLNNYQRDVVSIKDFLSQYGMAPEWAFEIWRPALNDVAAKDLVKEALPRMDWQAISLELYCFFWTSSLYDIDFDREMYDKELAQLEHKLSSLQSRTRKAEKDKSTTGLQLKVLDEERIKIGKIVEGIEPDCQKHENHYNAIMEHVQTSKDEWFGPESKASSFVDQCILPRACHSPFDAVFTAKFIFYSHRQVVPGFSVMDVLDSMLIKDILFQVLFTGTPSESENLGLFFAEVVTHLEKWRVDKEVSLDGVSHAQYCGKLYTCHSVILESVCQCLMDHEYMARSNAISFLKSLWNIYPKVEDHSEHLLEVVQNIVDNDQRQDLKLASRALVGFIKSRAKEWIPMVEFYEMDEQSKEEQLNKRKEMEDKRKREEELRKQEALKKEEAMKKRNEESVPIARYGLTPIARPKPHTNGDSASPSTAELLKAKIEEEKARFAARNVSNSPSGRDSDDKMEDLDVKENEHEGERKDEGKDIVVEEGLQKEKLEEEKLEGERMEKETRDNERREMERENERREMERERERRERERRERERREKERLEKERREKERLDKEKREKERLEKERRERMDRPNRSTPPLHSNRPGRAYDRPLPPPSRPPPSRPASSAVEPMRQKVPLPPQQSDSVRQRGPLPPQSAIAGDRSSFKPPQGPRNDGPPKRHGGFNDRKDYKRGRY